MDLSAIELLAHPIRVRIIQALEVNGRLTAQQIAQLQFDIPHTTLYRHLHVLAEGGIIIVVEERQVRGTVERVYELVKSRFNIDPAEAMTMSKEEHLKLFTLFGNLLISNFNQYLQQHEQLDFVRDGVGYRQSSLLLDDSQFSKFTQELADLFARWSSLDANPQQRKRLISFVSLPAGDVVHADTQQKEH